MLMFQHKHCRLQQRAHVGIGLIGQGLQ